MIVDADASTTSSTPLLENNIVPGVVDHKNRPVQRSVSGGWKSASFILVVELAERFAYYGISLNMISYLTGTLCQSTATAATNVNAWTGTTSLLPILGAFVADSYLGRYPTIVISSLLYILALGLLTLAALIIPSSSAINCQSANSTLPYSPPRTQVILFFFSLYLVSVAQGGHKPCVQAFGADQFDVNDPKERKAKSLFFNWWGFSLSIASLVSVIVLSYTQDNLSWVLGFGIPCIAMAISLLIYLLGTVTYRFGLSCDHQNPFVRIGNVFVQAAKNHRKCSTAISVDEEASGILHHQEYQNLNFLNKALHSSDGSKVCSISEVQEAKAVLRLAPIWASCLGFGIVNAQTTTFYTKQGVTMDRSIGSRFQIPPAALHSFVSLGATICIPIYDRILVPIARTITSKPSGITTLQRIGVGILFSILSMVVAAIVEMKRLQTALDYGLVDNPGATIPMTVWWLVPQYLFTGIADVFAIIGMQELFYDEVPSDLKSIGLSLVLSILGVGSFLSSFLISIIEKFTGGDGEDSWLSDNLNRAHLDYFYWVLCGLSAMALMVYLYFARSYIYSQGLIV